MMMQKEHCRQAPLIAESPRQPEPPLLSAACSSSCLGKNETAFGFCIAEWSVWPSIRKTATRKMKKNDTRCAAFALFEDTAVGRPTFYNEATVSEERFLSEVSNTSFAAAAEKTKATGRPSILRPVRRPGGHPGGVRPALLRRRLVLPPVDTVVSAACEATKCRYCAGQCHGQA